MGLPTPIAHLGAQTFAAPGSAALQHIAPADSRHAQTEPVGPLSFNVGRLIGPFHSVLLKKGYSVKRARHCRSGTSRKKCAVRRKVKPLNGLPILSKAPALSQIGPSERETT